MVNPKLRALIQSVADSADAEGCSDDLTVASKSAIEALAAYLEPTSQEEYAETGGFDCPYCRNEDIEYNGNVRLHGDKCFHDCKCRRCGKSWVEEYTLTGYHG